MNRLILKGSAFLHARMQPLIAVGFRMAGLLLSFAITAYIAQSMGAAASGNYALVTQTAMLGAVVAAGGMDLAILRNFSVAKAYGTHPSRRSIVQIFTLSFALCALVACVIAGVGLGTIGVDFADVAPPIALGVALALLFARTVLPLSSAFLRSQRHYIPASIIEVISLQAFALFCIALGLAQTLDAMLIVTATGGVLTALVGLGACLWISRKRQGRDAGTADAQGHSVSLKTVVKTAAPLWGVSVSRNAGEWYGLAVVAALLSVHDAGVFRVASTISLALAVISSGVLSVYTPQIGSAFAQKNYAEIARLTRASSLLSTFLVLPITLPLLLFSEVFMGFFGEEFRDGAALMQILVAGQALFVCTGTSGITLAMTGHERINFALTLASLAALLLLVPLAALYGGLMAVGVVLSLVLVGRNIGTILATRRYLGIGMVTGRYHPLPHHNDVKNGAA